MSTVKAAATAIRTTEASPLKSRSPRGVEEQLHQGVVAAPPDPGEEEAERHQTGDAEEQRAEVLVRGDGEDADQHRERGPDAQRRRPLVPAAADAPQETAHRTAP